MVLVRSRSVAYLSIEQVRRAFGQGPWTGQMPWHHWNQARLAAWELDRHWTGSAFFWQLGPLNTKKRAKERKLLRFSAVSVSYNLWRSSAGNFSMWVGA